MWAAHPAKSTSMSAKPRSNSTSPRPKPSNVWWTSSRSTTSGWSRRPGNWSFRTKKWLMADSRIQAQAENWIRETWLPKHFTQPFHKEKLRLSSGGLFEFDAISHDGKLIASISTDGGITAPGRKAAPKLNKVRSDILFLLLYEANRRLVLLTDKAMFDLCEQERAKG